MGLWHLTFASSGRHVLFTSEAQVLEGVHAVARGATNRVVLFCIVDDHVHVVVHTDAPGWLATGLLRALRAVAETQLTPAFVRAVEDRGHLEWLASRYILTQSGKHGLPGSPALWSGSCFLDLVGARRVAGLGLQLATVLPRYRLRQAFTAVGLEAKPLTEPTTDELRTLGVARLVAAATAAVGTHDASSRDALANRARRVAVSLSREAALPSALLAAELGCRVGSVSRLASAPCCPLDRRAALRRLALERVVELAHASPNSAQTEL